jgi:hypothetical protein
MHWRPRDLFGVPEEIQNGHDPTDRGSLYASSGNIWDSRYENRVENPCKIVYRRFEGCQERTDLRQSALDRCCQDLNVSFREDRSL